MFRSVVIVGRPNVGKSRLFNRLARKRISIVHDQPGVTRDVISAEVERRLHAHGHRRASACKEGETSSAAIIAASERQVGFAIDTAALILFVIDGLDRVTALDDRIAGRLRRGGKPVILVVNKADFGDEKADHEGVAASGSANRSSSRPSTAAARASCARRSWQGSGTRPRGAGRAPSGPRRAQAGQPGPICICFIGRPERREVVAREPAPSGATG